MSPACLCERSRIQPTHTLKAAAVVIGGFCPGSTDVTSFLMTEARQQNTEIRLSIGKVVDKVDQLSSKVWAMYSPVSSSCVGDAHWFPLPCF